MRRIYGWLLPMLLVAGSAMAAATTPGTWKDARLADFLTGLDEYGIRIIFSSDLVRDELRLQREPGLDETDDIDAIRAEVEEILTGFGLALADGPDGSLLVVRAANPPGLRPSHEAPAPPEPPLPEIIVTSSLHRLEVVQTETHTSFDRELATRMPTTAGEVVRLTNHLPGTASGGVSARNHVRGGEVNEVLYLLDGLRLYEPFHLKDFQSIATTVNSNAIESIDLYAGAFPAHYGDRMSGVMKLELREPGARPETELALSFFNASLLSLGSFGSMDQGDWLVTARRGNLDLIVDVVDPDAGSPRYNDLLLHGGWEFGPRSAFAVNFLNSTDKIELNDTDRGESARARYGNEVVWLRWDAQWNDALRSEAIAAYTSIDNSRRGSLDLTGIVTGALEETESFRIASLKQDWSWSASPRWLWRAGFDAKHLDGTFDFSASRNLVPPFDTLFDNTSQFVRDSEVVTEGDQFAVYLEGRWRARERLFIEAGVRWDTQGYTLADDDRQTSPRLSVLWRLGNRTDLRLGWGQYSQAQEINELQVSDGVLDYFPAQRAEHFVSSLEHRFDSGMQLELSLYSKNFKSLRPRFENAFNTLTLLPEIQFDRIRIDARAAESRGAEVLVSRENGSRDLVWWIGYAWSAVEDRTPDGRIPRAWDQTHTGKAGLSWRWKAWNFSVAGRVHSGWPHTELFASPDAAGPDALQLETSAINAAHYPPFQTLDLRVSRDFRMRRGRLHVFLDVTNAYNRANACCLEFSLAEDPSAPALARHKAHWLPALPSLGVIWSF